MNTIWPYLKGSEWIRWAKKQILVNMKGKKEVLSDKEVALAYWPEVLEEWLALTSVNYHRNIYVSILLDPN